MRFQRVIIFLGVLVLTVPTVLAAGKMAAKPAPKSYLDYVTISADYLLKYGTDKYGTRKTAIWAGIIDTRDFSVPENNVGATEGVRSHDRAEGGGNLYHDVTSIKVFMALSDLLGDQKYEKAVRAYVSDYLEYAQSPYNGLMGWGEHLYYHFYRDSVLLDVERVDERGTDYYPHEFLGWTPPWGLLWETDAERTARAIRAIRYHYNGPDPKVYMFTRHANYFKAEHQDYVQPWIKHSGLYAYSYGFLYNKTGDADALYWSKHTGNLYWKLRDPETNLTLGCFFHGNKAWNGKYSSTGGASKLAYWMYKAWELTGEAEQREKALAFMDALDKYHWNNEAQAYYGSLDVDGSLFEGSSLATAWKIGYGSSSVVSFGRVAAYLAKRENNPRYLIMARRTALAANTQALPDQFTAENIADAMNINLDLYDLTGEDNYLEAAEGYAKKGIDGLWRDGLFARQSGDDPYYEAKLGIGDLMQAFLRLHLALNPQQTLETEADWSF